MHIVTVSMEATLRLLGIVIFDGGRYAVDIGKIGSIGEDWWEDDVVVDDWSLEEITFIEVCGTEEVDIKLELVTEAAV